jgi:asparagine synthase (glutamine-hydrolysing)
VDQKVKNRVGKHLLKQLAERYFPSEFVHRRKMGFAIPLARWLRGPLQTVLNETLSDSRLMAPLSSAVINRTLREFEAGNDRHKSRLWALLMFGIWRSQQEESIVNVDFAHQQESYAAAHNQAFRHGNPEHARS